MAAYGYICAACDHPISMHTASSDCDPVTGPYICSVCGCEIVQNAPMFGLNRTEFKDHERDAGR